MSRGIRVTALQSGCSSRKNILSCANINMNEPSQWFHGARTELHLLGRGQEMFFELQARV